MLSPEHLFQIQEFDDHPEQQLDFMLDLGLTNDRIERFRCIGAPEIEQHNGKYGTASCNVVMYWWHLPKVTYELFNRNAAIG